MGEDAPMGEDAFDFTARVTEPEERDEGRKEIWLEPVAEIGTGDGDWVRTSRERTQGRD